MFLAFSSAVRKGHPPGTPREPVLYSQPATPISCSNGLDGVPSSNPNCMRFSPLRSVMSLVGPEGGERTYRKYVVVLNPTKRRRSSTPIAILTTTESDKDAEQRDRFRNTRWRASAPSSSSSEDLSSQSSSASCPKEEYRRETVITLLSSLSDESHESSKPGSEQRVVRKARLWAGRVFGMVTG